MSSTATSTLATNGLSPKITLYTNHRCPWAHRAHIALKELNLPYEEVLIDLDRPREEWYLKINPRGLVPAISFSNGVLDSEIVTESAIVVQFLADAVPSHLLPASHSSPTAALTRARIAFFVDAYFSKVYSKMFEAMCCTTEEDKMAKADEIAAAVEKEIEPLLENAAPFFGGSEQMTLAECLTAPFVLRTHAFARAGLLHQSLLTKLDALRHYKKWQEVMLSQESVRYVWDEKIAVESMKERLEKIVANSKLTK